MKTTILAAVLAVALMLAGCGGGSKGGAGAGMPSTQTPTTPRPTVRVVPLSVPGEPETPAVAVEIPDNTVRINPGQTREVSVGGRSVSVRCPSGGASCHVGVHEGSLWYRLDGAIPFALAGLPSTPTPTTPPTRVIEPPLTPLITWRELPTLVDRMTHRTELRSKSFAGSSCDDGVTACQAVVKTLLANATENGREEYHIFSWAGRVLRSAPVKTFAGRRTFEIEYISGGVTYPRDVTEYFNGGWLDNSIFIVSAGPVLHPYSNEADDYFGRGAGARHLSMGIRDTNPVTGVYRGVALNTGNGFGTFELNYTSGATGGQLDMTLRDQVHNRYTWTNVSVDNEGYFDNDITRSDRVLGGNKLEGRFYQGGEVGGVYSYREGQNPNVDSFRYGAFGGKLDWSLPVD